MQINNRVTLYLLTKNSQFCAWAEINFVLTQKSKNL